MSTLEFAKRKSLISVKEHVYFSFDLWFDAVKWLSVCFVCSICSTSLFPLQTDLRWHESCFWVYWLLPTNFIWWFRILCICFWVWSVPFYNPAQNDHCLMNLASFCAENPTLVLAFYSLLPTAHSHLRGLRSHDCICHDCL